MIPEAKIQEVKQSADILALFRSYGLKTEKRGRDWFTSCPFHDDDTPSLSIDPERNIYHCLGCGAKGNIYQLVEQMEGKTFPEAFEKVSGITGLSINTMGNPKTSSIPKPTATKYTPEELQQTLTAAYEQMRHAFVVSPHAQFYMKEKRGIDNALDLDLGFCLTEFGRKLDLDTRNRLITLGILNEKGRPHFASCVVFPLRTPEGQLVGLYGRKTNHTGLAGRSNPKPGSHYFLPGPRDGVYGIHDGESTSVYITESVIDAISLNQLGITSVLALHGVNGFTPAHEGWLKAKHIQTIYMLLDGDAPGREAAARLKEQLKQKGYMCNIYELPEGEDPNSFFLSGKSGQTLAAGGKPLKQKRTLKDLKALPGHPTVIPSQELTIIRKGDEYIINGDGRTYTVKGLTGFGFDRIRVTIKVTLNSDPSRFHIDSLDLYGARARGVFIDGIVKELGGEPESIHIEVKLLITLLEKERLAIAGGEPETKRPTMTPAEKEEALTALKDRALIKNLLKDFEACGMIGEEKAKLLCYIGTVSCLLENPLGILIISRSGAGKTALQDAVCSFVPEEALIKYTRLTGQALFYKDENSLKHKVLAIEEEEGMEQAVYAIRTLQSSQRLCVATTRSDPKTGKLKTDEYTVEGPVFIMIATTNPDSLDHETRNRFILMTIDETNEQTERILNARRYKYTLEGRMLARNARDILKKYHNMQRLLRPIKVVNPYAQVLEYPFDRLQMRREFDKYMTLINAIALLHQHQRPVKTADRGGRPFEYIEVSPEDIALANKLVLEFFPYSLDELAPHTRKFCHEIRKYIEANGGDVSFTRKQLRDFTGWSDWPVRQALEQLVELGYLSRTGVNGTATLYKLLVDATEEGRKKIFLTSANELKAKFHDLRK